MMRNPTVETFEAEKEIIATSQGKSVKGLKRLILRFLQAWAKLTR